MALRQQEPVEALALRTVAALLGLAETDDEGLSAALQGLDSRARTSLRQVAITVRDSGWNVSGELKKRGWSTTPLTFSVDGADRMIDATEQRKVDERIEPFYGKVDGWSWSDLKVKFKLEAGKWLRASILNSALQRTVADLVSTPDEWVEGTVRVISVSGDDPKEKVHVTRILESLKPRVDTQAMIDARGHLIDSTGATRQVGNGASG